MNKIAFITVGLVMSGVANLSHANPPKIPYNQCEGISDYSYYQSFPNQQVLKKFYPDALTSNHTKLPFVDTKNFNFACGATALAGQITIEKNGDTSIRECGDLSWQTEEQACKFLYRGKYQDKLRLKSGDYYKISQGKIFLFNKDGTIDVTSLD